ncbi:hypothetical protein E2C01_006056 [Portunus trituberculatus]|uniref:Uncharacterized protein n=1 Tax=Portunus trituberculatus TaxID=210409 RepID=A0A5B7CY91_PORTR|nr:hypothetical protein [Portunus trituberculatus]
MQEMAEARTRELRSDTKMNNKEKVCATHSTRHSAPSHTQAFHLSSLSGFCPSRASTSFLFQSALLFTLFFVHFSAPQRRHHLHHFPRHVKKVKPHSPAPPPFYGITTSITSRRPHHQYLPSLAAYLTTLLTHYPADFASPLGLQLPLIVLVTISPQLHPPRPANPASLGILGPGGDQYSPSEPPRVKSSRVDGFS